MFDVLINYLRYPANHRFGFLVRRPLVFHKDRYHIAVPTGKQYEANIIYADVLPALVPVAGSGLVPQHCLRSLQRIRQPGRSRRTGRHRLCHTSLRILVAQRAVGILLQVRLLHS